MKNRIFLEKKAFVWMKIAYKLSHKIKFYFVTAQECNKSNS